MRKIKSGLFLIAAGVGLNIFSQFTLKLLPPGPSGLVMAVSLLFLMIAPAVLILFGVFGIVFGLLNKNRVTTYEVTPDNATTAADDTIWPPTPKPPKATE